MCLKLTLIPIQSFHFSDNTVVHSVFLNAISSYPHNNLVTLTGQVVSALVEIMSGERKLQRI